LQGLVEEKTVLVSAAKGFDVQTHARMSEVLAAAFPQNPIAVLSGPSHAEEVSRRIPTAIVSAAADMEIMKAVQELFSNSYMRVYANSDVIGVELGGSLKNIIALASGICYGLGCGDNTEAAVLTRGLTEIVRLGVCMGAEKSTFYGLSGMGDLVVTCGSRHSRNRTAGVMLGEGKKLPEILSEMGMVVEGINATQIAHALAAEYGVEMPITDSIYRVLYENVPIEGVVAALMQRDKKAE
jgi:glycerol-3-phosphate dehydrogenase (NAD(P)+)